ACDGNDSDFCEEGFFICFEGEMVCSDDTGDEIEICDAIDNDCNGMVDDGVCEFPNAVGLCEDNGCIIGWCEDGWVDCNGIVEDGCEAEGTIYYYDWDNDGYGVDYQYVYACEMPENYAPVGGDCNDYNSSINPGATEECDGYDNNCNDQIDEGLCDYPNAVTHCDPVYGCVIEYCLDGFFDCNGNPLDGCESTGILQYFDEDGDGYGDDNQAIYECELIEGFVLQGGDCDDSEYYVNPGATEICNNGIDDDCDGLTDGEDPDCQ
ncbi:MAG: putative metal-binding motif-containing protein, partial [Bacteroidales bacterium]|nr:putative metal-binding motif-containing protein [Bacteroidales bacterium]